MKTLRISDDLHTFLRKQGVKGDTFEHVIWSLIGVKALTKEQEKDYKEGRKGYEKSL